MRLEQGADHAGVTALGRFLQRRCAIVVAGIDVRAGLDQALEQRLIVPVRGPVQRRGAVAGRVLRIGATVQQSNGLGAIVRSAASISGDAASTCSGRAASSDKQTAPHQISTNFCVLSPNFSMGTPIRSSSVRCTLAMGVRSAYFRCWLPLSLPMPPPTIAVGSG